MKRRKTAIIIGSGIGGLSTGARLARKGFRVTVFERLHQPGGYVHTFSRNGYTFEATTHQLSGYKDRNYLKNTMKLLGIEKDLKISESEHSFEAVIYSKETHKMEKRFLIKAGYRQALESLYSLFPDEKETIKKSLRKIYKISMDLMRLKKIQREFPLKNPYALVTALWLKHRDSNSIWKKLGKKAYRYLAEYKDKTYNEIIGDIRNDDIRFILSQHSAYIALNPGKVYGFILAVMVYIYILRKPVEIKGGTASLLKALLRQITENGGEIRYKSKVEKILMEGDKAVGVRVEDGSEHFADYIVSNASAYDTYHKFIDDKSAGEKLCKDYVPSGSVFQLYLGLPFDIQDHGFRAGTTVFSSTNNLDEAFHENMVPNERTSFLVTNYNVTNPEFSAKGKSSLVIAEYDSISRWLDISKDEYKKQKEETQKLILEKASRVTGVPFDKAEVCFSGTPKTMSFYSGDEFGSMIGGELNLKQGALNRWQHTSHIKNLVLAGSDAPPAGGVSACLDSGVIAANSIMRRN